MRIIGVGEPVITDKPLTVWPAARLEGGAVIRVGHEIYVLPAAWVMIEVATA